LTSSTAVFLPLPLLTGTITSSTFSKFSLSVSNNSRSSTSLIAFSSLASTISAKISLSISADSISLTSLIASSSLASTVSTFSINSSDTTLRALPCLFGVVSIDKSSLTSDFRPLPRFVELTDAGVDFPLVGGVFSDVHSLSVLTTDFSLGESKTFVDSCNML